ncbi:unnamed protein product [Brassicogethes aeneus]|uniref:EF-hand domain-containing protein n=1 Tax=Brassicogethes aeneus TaxID=1431903 RepID=A0A9P0B699_BRAAE|nr:unnamed protein product [Brassicogethes aeneus]
MQFDDDEEPDMKTLLILDTLKKNDPENTKTVDLKDLKQIIREIGVEYTEAEIYRFIEQLDPEKTGFVSHDLFLEIMGPFVDLTALTADLSMAFRIIDKEGKGYITEQDLAAISDILGGFLDEDDVHDIMLEANKDHDNKMKLHEFENMMSLEF